MNNESKTISRSKRHRSTQLVFRRTINYLLYLAFCGMAATGLLMAFKLPPGREGGHGLSVFGLDRHEWGDIHLWIGYAFLALILVHLYLARSWILKIATNRRRGVLFASLAIGLLPILILLLAPVRK